MPYEPDPGDEAPEPDRLSFRASREVRHTVIRIITAHLKDGAAVPWQGLNFDFWSVVFDGGDFRGAKFLDGTVDFHGAEFSSGTVYFDEAEFSGGTVSFDEAEFSGGTVSFRYAEFSGAMVTFIGTRFSGATVNFYRGEFSGGMIYFNGAEFSGGTVDFPFARFSGTEISLAGGMSMDPAPGARSSPPRSPAARSTSWGSVTGHTRQGSPGWTSRPEV